MKLNVLYYGDGTKRMYREDEEGNLFVFYVDKEEKIIIRDFFESDTKSWYNTMMSALKLRSAERNRYLERVNNLISKRKEDDYEFTLLITTNTGKVLGDIDFYPVEGEEGTQSILTIHLKDVDTVQRKAESVLKAIDNMVKQHRYYDKVFLKNAEGELKELKIS